VSARRKKQRRLRDLRTLAAAGLLTRDEADSLGEQHGLGTVTAAPERIRRGRPRAGKWATEKASETRERRRDG